MSGTFVKNYESYSRMLVFYAMEDKEFFDVFLNKVSGMLNMYFKIKLGPMSYQPFFCYIGRNQNFQIVGLWEDVKKRNVQRDVGGREICLKTSAAQLLLHSTIGL